MSSLKKILIRSRKNAIGELVGENNSKLKGEGYDFVNLKEYALGDDIRYIDWNITAKMQKPYVKVFNEQRELNIVLVALLDGNMIFDKKQELLAEIMAFLGYSTIKNRDNLSYFLFSQDFHIYQRASKREFCVHKMTKTILEFDPLFKRCDLDLLAKTLQSKIKRRSLIVVVGDFFELPDFRVLAKKHEIVCILTRSKLEEEPNLSGVHTLQDAKSAIMLESDFGKKSINEYRKKVTIGDAKLREVFHKDMIRYTKIYTDENIVPKLIRLFR